MTPTETATLAGQIALGILTVLGLLLKEMSDRRSRKALADDLEAKERQAELTRAARAAALADKLEERTAHLETKLDTNTAMTSSAAEHAGRAYTAANNFSDRMGEMQARFDALLQQQVTAQGIQVARQTVQIERQADQIERIDTTTTESKELLEDLHETTLPKDEA